MKVLLYADVDLSLPGGVETHVKELATHLTQLSHEVHIYGRPDRLEGFDMVSRVDADRYDVLHHHGGKWPDRLDGHPRYLKTLHFCVAAKMEAYVRLGRLRTLVNPGNWSAVAEERAAVRRDGRFIPVSTRVMEQFERWHGLDAARATLIPNGVNPDTPHADPAELRKRHGIADDTRVLLTIGRADFVKGYGLLGRALRRARPSVGPRIVWVTVGGDRSMRSDDRIVTGPVSHAEALGWIRAAQVGAMPSYYEGNSVALLEMLEGGLFALAHDVGAAADVITDPTAGQIVGQNVDAWAEALQNALAQQAVSTRVPQLDASYHWANIAQRTARLYEKVASPSSKT